MTPENQRRLLGRRAAAIAVASLMALSFVAGTLAPTAAASPTNYAPVKWLLIQDGSVGDYGDKLGYHQFWLNFMRDLGTPFDVVDDTAVTYDTFWNSAGEPNYQAFIYAGVDCLNVPASRGVCPDLHHEPPSTALSAMQSAVYGGINGIFIASAIQGLQHLWGISTVGELSSNQRVTWRVTATFSGVNGTVFRAGFNTTSANPVGQLVTTGWSGNASMLIEASWPGGSSAAAGSVPYGAGTAYFWSGTEGRVSAYREGYQSVFSMATGDMSSGDNSNYVVAQQLRESLFRYVYDAWKYRVQILPWETGGSAIIFRMDDGYIGQIYNTTYPWNSAWNLNELASAGLSADLTIPIQGGWVTAVEDCPLSGKDIGSMFPSYTASGYRFFCSWREGGLTNHAMVFSRLDNITQAVDDGSVTVTSNESQTFAITDGNSTLIRQLKVKISTSANPAYEVQILNPSGGLAWSTGELNATYSSPTWVTFKPNATFVQGTGLRIAIRVFSGSVNWDTASPGTYTGGGLSSNPSSDADFVVVGGTYWDIVSLDLDHSLNWTDAGQTTQAGLLMASGAPYPSENRTFQFKGFPPQESFKRFTVDWVNGRTTSNGPPKQLTLVWYSTEGDWLDTLAGQATRSFYLNYTNNYGFNLVFKGRFHHPFQGSSYRGSDFSWNSNSSYYSYGSIVAEVASLVKEAKAIFGPSFNTLVQTAPYSGDTYPPNAIYDSTYGKGAFWQAGLRIAWLGNDQSAASNFWRNVVIGGFRQFEPASTYDGVSQLDWSHTYAFVGTNYQDMQLLRQDFAGAQTKSDLSASEILSYYNQFPSEYKQPYDLNSTVFMGTTKNLFSFWNSTMSMLQNMPAAYYQGGNLTLEFNARNNVPGPVKDLVWRLPGRSPFGDGLTLKSVVANVTGWSVANQTSEYVYLEAAHATGRTKIVASYGAGPTEVQIMSNPGGLSGAISVDGEACSVSPCTYQWPVGSTHNVTAALMTPNEDGVRYAWSGWPSGEPRSFLVTARFLPENFTAYFTTQYLLSVTSPCPLYGGGGWFDSGTVAVASTMGICHRSGGEGIRVSSILIGGARNASVATGGNASISLTMNQPLNVTFDSVEQFSLTLNQEATLGLVSMTSPTLPGDRYWYDNGTAITLVLRGIYGRGDGVGLRLAAYTLDGWNTTSVARIGNVTTLTGYPIHAPLSVAASLATDYLVVAAPGSSASGAVTITTPPTLPGDTGWYDTGTRVLLQATSNPGYSFQGWQGNVVLSPGQQTPDLSVLVSEPIAETAQFSPVPIVQNSTASYAGGQPFPVLEALAILGAGVFVALSAYAFYSFLRRQDGGIPEESSANTLRRRQSGST